MKRFFAYVIAGLLLVGKRAAAADSCRTCDSSKGAAEASACLAETIKDKVCFEWSGACDPAGTHTLTAGAIKADPFDVTCPDGKKLTVALAKDKQSELAKLAGAKIELKFGSFSAKASIPELANEEAEEKKEAEGASAVKGSKADTPVLLPIDVQPHVESAPHATGADIKYIYVHENLAVAPGSALFVTETDRIVIRFIARKALLCRYYAVSDDKNEYKPEPGRIGGREGLKAILQKSGLVGLGDKVDSCGVPNGLRHVSTDPDGTQRFEPDGAGAVYGHTDFSFGPFTSEQLTFHVFRHDAAFKGNDLQAVVKVANHKRYTGWLDVSTVVAALASPHRSVAVRPQNGTEITRLHVDEDRYQLDLVAQVKLFITCSGEGNRALAAQDLQTAGACFGFGSGFSLLHPTRRFYPLGVNLTIAHYLSLNAFLTFQKATTLASGYTDGDIYTGSADDITTKSRLVPGVALGIGLDPTLLGELVGAIVKAGIP